MDTDIAWDEFRKNSERFQKASVAEKLDTLAAAINSIKTDTERTAEVVPTIMGDESALGAANEMAAQSPMPEAAPMMGGAEAGMSEEGMPPEGAPAGAPEEGMPVDAGLPPEGPVPGAEDMSMPEPGVPGTDMMGAEGDDDYLTEADIQEILGGAPAEEAPEGMGMPEVGNPEPEIPATGEGGLAEAANGLLMAIKQAMHEAVDAGDMNRVMELSNAQQQLSQSMGGLTGEAVPDMGLGGEDMTQAMPQETGLTGDMAAGAPDEFSDLGADTGDVGADSFTPMDPAELGLEGGSEGEAEGLPETEEGPEMDVSEEISEEPAPEESEVAPESSEAPSEEKKGDEKKDDKSDDKKDDEKKDDKKEDDEDSESTKKSLPMPSLKDMMSNKFNISGFMKSDFDGVIEKSSIYQDENAGKVDMSGVVDGGTFLKKSDSRIASARNIFEKALMTGTTDPGSIATAGEAQEALNQKGTQNPDSIATADPIMNIRKSEEDVASMPKTSGGTTDPDSIATAGTAQEALAHKGKQDPDSIAQPDVPVNMNGGDKSEGTTTKPDIKIEKSSDDPNFPDLSKMEAGDTMEDYYTEPPGTPNNGSFVWRSKEDFMAPWNRSREGMYSPKGDYTYDRVLEDGVYNDYATHKRSNVRSRMNHDTGEGIPQEFFKSDSSEDSEPKDKVKAEEPKAEAPKDEPKTDPEPAAPKTDTAPSAPTQAPASTPAPAPAPAPAPTVDVEAYKKKYPQYHNNFDSDVNSEYGGLADLYGDGRWKDDENELPVDSYYKFMQYWPDFKNNVITDKHPDYQKVSGMFGDDDEFYNNPHSNEDYASRMDNYYDYIKGRMNTLRPPAPAPAPEDLSGQFTPKLSGMDKEKKLENMFRELKQDRTQEDWELDHIHDKGAQGDAIRNDRDMGYNEDESADNTVDFKDLVNENSNMNMLDPKYIENIVREYIRNKKNNMQKSNENPAPANVPLGDGDNIAKAEENMAPAEVPDPAGVNVAKACDDDVKKSAPGKHIPSIQEMFSIAKSGSRPSLESSMGGTMVAPDPENLNAGIKKSETIRMGRGVDPMKVIENDLEEWNHYKDGNKF